MESFRAVATGLGMGRVMASDARERAQIMAAQAQGPMLSVNEVPPPSTMMGALVERLTSTSAWAHDLAQRIEAMADRANGSVPMEASGSVPRAENIAAPPPVGQQLHQQVDVIEMALRRLQAAHQRLAEFV